MISAACFSARSSFRNAIEFVISYSSASFSAISRSRISIFSRFAFVRIAFARSTLSGPVDFSSQMIWLAPIAERFENDLWALFDETRFFVLILPLTILYLSGDLRISSMRLAWLLMIAIDFRRTFEFWYSSISWAGTSSCSIWFKVFTNSSWLFGAVVL